MDAVTRYNPDPGDQARRFVAAGCAWIHVVDLDGAVGGAAVNRHAVAEILKAGAKVQLGGGIRDMAMVEAWLDAGINRVILGTAALKNPALVREAAAVLPIAVGADARDGMIAAEGWLKHRKCRRLSLSGVLKIVVSRLSFSPISAVMER